MTAKLLRGIEQSGGSWTDFGLIPFTPEITNWQNFPKADSYFVYTSTKGLRVLTEDKFAATEIFKGADEETANGLLAACRRGIFYNEDRFDMSQYLPHLRRHLLNGHGEIMKLRDLMPMSFKTDKFIKPGRDLKIFTGAVVDAGTTFEEYLETIQYDQYFHHSLDENVIVSDPVEILAEWRFFIVKGSVVAGSQYRKFGKMHWTSDIPAYVHSEAKRMSGIYRPAKCFTMDLAMTGDLKIKIVEYNCINCSGLYNANVGNLAFELRWV
jgi:hypothetical protein